MRQAGIATEIHYPTPIHLQPACKQYGYRPGSLPITEIVAERIVSLPMYPELTAMQTQAVVDAVLDSIVSYMRAISYRESGSHVHQVD